MPVVQPVLGTVTNTFIYIYIYTEKETDRQTQTDTDKDREQTQNKTFERRAKLVSPNASRLVLEFPQASEFVWKRSFRLAFVW